MVQDAGGSVEANEGIEESDRTANNPLVSMRSVVKRFGSILALDHVDIEIMLGEVLALLGENGAGKSTLMNILSGLYRADEGEILFEGKPIVVRSPRDAIVRGIIMVHQHFELIQNFTVLENIIIGTGSNEKGKEKSVRKEVEKLAAENNITLDLDARVKGLPVGVQQKVEILKALYRNPKILILDEPTSNLTPQEVDSMLSTIRKLAEKGYAVIFITHKVREALAVAKRITILRNGHVMGKFSSSEVTADSLVEMMMGAKPSSNLESSSHTSPPSAEPLLTLSDVRTGSSKGRITLKDINLTLNPGEILGIAGVSGNGQKELVEAIMMLRKPTHGSVRLLGVDPMRLSTKEIIELGVSYIPEDRLDDGILPSMTLYENMVLGSHDIEPFSKRWIMDRDAMIETTRDAIERYRIYPPQSEARVGVLSGGNIQKLLVGRALLSRPKVILAHNPTRGLDTRTTDLVLRNLVAQSRENGAGVLLLSEDLDELISVCDRIAVMFRGEVVGVLDRQQMDRYRIGAMMAGGATA
ncbi:MAG: ABC transporter ATP-binding protein [Nitrososphaerota archaeon]|jgi:simple sugar transport system ATP-binding protein|nr:ABC transporter ATP-binding protein [Nitrososphaerota archaeon]